MRTEVEVAQRYDHPRERVFDVLVDAPTLSKICLRRGPIAAIVEATMVDGAPLEVGAHRTVRMDDGVVLDEEIIAFTRPEVHGYAWSGGLKFPFSWVVRAAEGRWTFEDDDGGTLVRWHYGFELTTPAAYPIAAIAMGFFRGWMAAALARGNEILDG